MVNEYEKKEEKSDTGIWNIYGSDVDHAEPDSDHSAGITGNIYSTVKST